MGERRKDMGELKKIKHNHLLTTLLKNIIFAIVMLAPFFAVLSRCMYVIFNKNAKDSYSEKSSVTLKEVTNSNLIVSDYYQVNYFNNEINNQSFSCSVNENDLNKYTNNTDTITSFFLYANTSNATRLELRFLNSPSQVINNWQDIDPVFHFNLKGVSASPSNTGIISMAKLYHLMWVTGNLDNAFEYSVNQLNDMQIFNWTNNTAIYTPINSMCSGLGFTQNDNVIALLLTYWAINTAIYIIFDIVIACFTKLTHFMASE